jgi:hypothetical protein
LIERRFVASTVALLKRSRSIPKQAWRESSCPRTFAPIDFESLIRSTWQANQASLPKQSFVQVSLGPDGSPENALSIHAVRNGDNARLAVFDCTFVSADQAEVTLLEKACSALLGVPRRATRQIGLLTPWKPLRVALNGRTASYSDQLYLVREYCFALCAGPMPDQFQPARFVNLQADLM